jgi:hypothetical protein
MRKSGSPFLWFFAFITLLFCGILAFAYYESKRANPIMLDESGHVKGQLR